MYYNCLHLPLPPPLLDGERGAIEKVAASPSSRWSSETGKYAHEEGETLSRRTDDAASSEEEEMENEDLLMKPKMRASGGEERQTTKWNLHLGSSHDYPSA